MACFLDTKSYALSEASEDILNYTNIVADKFRPLLIANNCDLNKLPTEMEVLFEHVKRFLDQKALGKFGHQSS